MKRRCGIAVGWLLVSAAAAAQGAAPAGTPAPYTLRTTARAVVTDVLVQDGKGNPVMGLPEGAFHLEDNGKPVTIASFEEHRAEPPSAPATPAAPGVFTNDPARLPPVLDVAVIDVVQLSLPDQMFLADQLRRFIDEMPAGTSLALYLRAGQNSVLLQDFSADRARLQAAVKVALPHFASMGALYQTGVEALQQIAVKLKDLPGRKNVLWFTGGSPLQFTGAGWTLTPPPNTRAIFDELESERIAVYPVDARGLTTGLPMTNGRQGAYVEGQLDPVPAFDGNAYQRSLMQDVATETGGKAYYNTNGLHEAATRVVTADRNYYTVAYTPANFQVDNKWHAVRVKVEGQDLHLSYRRGYFADDAHVARPENVARTRLLAGGRTVVEQPEVRRAPIVFSVQAEALPAGAASKQLTRATPYGQVRYRLHVTVPAVDFQRQTVKGASELHVGVGVVATNRYGTPLLRQGRQMTFEIDEARLSRMPGAQVPLVQDVDLPTADTFVFLVVWDPVGERVGTLNLSLPIR